MSALAKILVVFNLFFAVTFMGTTATLFLKRDDPPAPAQSAEAYQSYKRSRDALKDLIAERKKSIGKTDDSFQALRTSVAKLTSDLEAKRGELASHAARRDAADKELADNESKISDLKDELASASQAGKALESDIDDSADALRQNQAKEAQYDAERNRMVRDKARVDREHAELQKEQLAVVDNMGHLTNRVAALHGQVGEDYDPAQLVTAKIDARIVDVDREIGAAILDKGRNQQVLIGHEFNVHRSGRLVGRVKVTKLYADRAGAKVLQELQKIRAGDRATTRSKLGK